MLWSFDNLLLLGITLSHCNCSSFFSTGAIYFIICHNLFICFSVDGHLLSALATTNIATMNIFVNFFWCGNVPNASLVYAWLDHRIWECSILNDNAK